MPEKARPLLRLLAYLIDLLLIFFVYILAAWHVSGVTTIPELFNRLLLVFILIPVGLVVFVPLYFLVTTSSWGGTAGKLLTGIEVVDEDGKYISLKRAFFRNYVGYTVSSIFFYLGFIWVAIDSESRGWHDMIANTSVVIKKRGGITFGLVALILLFSGNVIIGVQTIRQFQLNRSIYQEIGTEILTSLQSENPTQKESCTKKHTTLNYTVSYPCSWYVQVQSENTLASFVYFSTVKTDFDSFNPTHVPADLGFVNIATDSTADWFSLPEYKTQAVTDAKTFLDLQHKEEQDIVSRGGMMTIPGPPTYKDEPLRPLPPGTIEVEGVRTVEGGFEYWYVRGDTLYDIFILPPSNQALVEDFESKVSQLLSSLQIE